MKVADVTLVGIIWSVVAGYIMFPPASTAGLFVLCMLSKAACTHTGFLPESDRAPVVGVFTRTGITAAGGGRYLNQSSGTDRFR